MRGAPQYRAVGHEGRIPCEGLFLPSTGLLQSGWSSRAHTYPSPHLLTEGPHPSLTVTLHILFQLLLPHESALFTVGSEWMGLRHNSDDDTFQNMQFTYKMWELKIIGTLKTLPSP